MAAGHPFEEFQARFAELLESSPAKDLQRNAKAFLNSAFTRLELVTREEFDVQSKLLGRMADRLAALEARVAALEAERGGGSPKPAEQQGN